MGGLLLTVLFCIRSTEAPTSSPAYTAWYLSHCLQWLGITPLHHLVLKLWEKKSYGPKCLANGQRSKTGAEDMEAAHNQKRRDGMWRATRPPGHGALEEIPCCLCSAPGATTGKPMPRNFRVGSLRSNPNWYQGSQEALVSFLTGLLPSIFAGYKDLRKCLLWLHFI